jgi:signal peptidase I
MRKKWLLFKASLKEKSPWKYYVLDLMESLVVALIVVLIIRETLIQPSVVPTPSMVPTLKVGDRLFVNRVVYYYSTPQRGDIIVFPSPEDDGKDYVKRCIGIPGDTIEIKNGMVFVNDKQFIVPGAHIQKDHAYYGPYKIYPGHYFVLGDNRAHSYDSRAWGFVKEEDVIGKAWFTFWPVNQIRIIR